MSHYRERLKRIFLSHTALNEEIPSHLTTHVLTPPTYFASINVYDSIHYVYQNGKHGLHDQTTLNDSSPCCGEARLHIQAFYLFSCFTILVAMAHVKSCISIRREQDVCVSISPGTVLFTIIRRPFLHSSIEPVLYLLAFVRFVPIYR